METLTKIIAVAIGGAFGAVFRYLLNLIFAEYFAPFPFATFFINVTGSFVIGFMLTLFGEKFAVSEYLQLALIVGFLGAYTTFSTFEFETFSLIREKNFVNAFLYLFSSVLLGFAGVLSGVWLARKL